MVIPEQCNYSGGQQIPAMLVVIESQSSALNIETGEQPNWFWITGLSQQHHLNQRASD